MRKTVLLFILLFCIASTVSCTAPCGIGSCRHCTGGTDGARAVIGIEAVTYPRPGQTPAYGYMTDSQRAAYDALAEFADVLCDSAGQRDLLFELSESVTATDMKTAMSAYGGDFGILLPRSACYIGEIRDDHSMITALYYTRSEIFIKKYDEYLQVTKAADAVLADLRHDGSDYGKALAIAKWLVGNVDNAGCTGEETDASEDSAYSALVNKTAADRGYAEAFDLLCKKAGLNSICVSGKRGEGRRAWNMIEIAEKWYHVDTAAMTVSDLYSAFMMPDSICMEEGQSAKYFEDMQTGKTLTPIADSFKLWKYYFPNSDAALRYFSEISLSDSTQYYAYIGNRSDRTAFLGHSTETVTDKNGAEYILNIYYSGPDKPFHVRFEKSPQ